MAVALRGYTQGGKDADGYVSLAWPAGTVAGDLAVVHCGGSVSNLGPQASGWTAAGYKVWYKIVTAADIAANLPVKATHHFLQTFTGAVAVGRTSAQSSVQLSVAGAGHFLHGSRSVANVAVENSMILGTEYTDNGGDYQAAHFRPATAAGTSVIAVNSGTLVNSYEILPSAGPSAPALVAPSSAAHWDAATACPLSWSHNSNAGLSQSHYKVKIVYGATTRYLTAAGTLTATETAVSSTATGATIAASQMAAGTTYTWSVATSEDGVLYSSYSSGRTIVVENKPTVGSITPTAAAGDLTPSVAWTATANVGALEAYRVWISPSAHTSPHTGPLYDSGILVGSATSLAIPVCDWTNGATLYAWVEVWQTGGLSSGPTKDDATFAVTWTPPSAVTCSAATGSPTVVTVGSITSGNGIQVEMSTDAGATYTLVADIAAPGTSKAVNVALTTYGVSTLFRARQYATVDDTQLYSAWTVAGAITPNDNAAYFIDPTDPSTYLVARIMDDGARELVQGVTTSYGLGASGPRVDFSPTAKLAGSMTCRTITEAEHVALVAWLTARETFIVRWPPASGTNLPPTTITRNSPVGYARVVQAAFARRDTSFAWVES